MLRSSLRNAGVVVAILLVIVIPTALTLNTVREATKPWDFTPTPMPNPTPLGYTISLSIYLVPVVAVYVWFRRRYQERGSIDYRRGAYRWTLMTLIPLGFLLDFVFGYAFFTFPNKNAVLGVPLPALTFSGTGLVNYLPIEEFVFYTLGFMAILSAYIWCDEYWLSAYNVPDYEMPANETGTRGLPHKILQLHFTTPLVISAVLVAVAVVYKLVGPHHDPHDHDGFPSYFTFLVLATLFPAVLFFQSTRRFINWRAVSFAVLCVTLTSLIWEATLAAPYGWWGYNHWHMLGLFIGAWYGLPIEAALLWIAVTFTTVIVYEMFKILVAIKQRTGQGWWAAIVGEGGRQTGVARP